MGIDLLENEHRIVETPAGSIAITGIGDIWSRHDDLEKALAGIPDELPVILLSHNPEVILDRKSRRASLVVSGHTHGGQIRLPFFGPIKGISARINRAHGHGVFAFNDTPRTTWLAVTRGLGEALLNLRLLARPEVMIIKTSSKSLESAVRDSEK
jgi:predicted MPP superfamily phosphohydrolase